MPHDNRMKDNFAKDVILGKLDLGRLSARFLMQQFHKTCFIRKASCQRSIECRQTEPVMAGKRHQIAVGDLICRCHRFRSHDAVGATQIVWDNRVARVGHESAENAKCQFGRQAVTEQRVRGDARKTKLDNRAGRKRGNPLEPRTSLA
jgi:hypothetical protein